MDPVVLTPQEEVRFWDGYADRMETRPASPEFILDLRVNAALAAAHGPEEVKDR